MPRTTWQPLTEGTLGDGPFRPAIKDFYLTNPIARASKLMAELQRRRQGPSSEADGRRMKHLAIMSPLALVACTPPAPVAEDFIPEYLGVETKLLDGDLVQFNVAMTKAHEQSRCRTLRGLCRGAIYADPGIRVCAPCAHKSEGRGWRVVGRCCLHDLANPAGRARTIDAEVDRGGLQGDRNTDGVRTYG